MAKMTRAQAKAFRDRWHVVGLAEAEERRHASLRLRWQQLNALWRMAVTLGLLPTEAEGVQDARKRWVTLKERCV